VNFIRVLNLMNDIDEKRQVQENRITARQIHRDQQKRKTSMCYSQVKNIVKVHSDLYASSIKSKKIVHNDIGTIKSSSGLHSSEEEFW